MTKSAWLVASAVVLAAPAAAASMGSFSPQRLADVDKTISADSFEGRGVNTRAETKTVNYIIDQFRSAGLQPGGDLVNRQRKWTQDVPLLQSELVGDPVVTIQTPGGEMRLAQGEQIAVKSPTNGQNQIRIANAPIVFAGYGVAAPERNWDDFKGHDVKGKIIVVLINDPDFEGGEGDFGGKAMTYYGRWTYKYEEAARQRRGGCPHRSRDRSCLLRLGDGQEFQHQLRVRHRPPEPGRGSSRRSKPGSSAMSRFSCSAMPGSTSKRLKQAAKRATSSRSTLKSTLSASANAKVSTITSHKVLGLVPGKTYPDETVIYSAHWDHLGIGKPDARGDTIYNGAIDNGTGIAELIELGRAFARGPRPDRSVVFMAVTAEEKGLLGSEYYATHPLYPAAKTAGAINMDVLGVLGPARDFSVRGNQKFGLLDMLVEEGAKRGRRFTPDPHPETGGFYRSDHFTLAKVGIPALSFTPGRDLVKGGVPRAEAWSKNYTATMYHQPADQFSSTWDFTGMADDAGLLFAVGSRLANSRDWPNWSADSEFRAARDQSAAERRNAAPAPAATPVAKPHKKGERG